MAVKTGRKKGMKSWRDQIDSMVSQVNIPQLIQLIEASNLPEHKKLLYLITISDGSFSLDDLQDIQAELDIYGQSLEEEQELLEDEILEMEAEIDSLQKELDQYAVTAFHEYESDVGRLVEEAYQLTEEGRKSTDRSQISKIRKGLKE